MLEDFGKVLLVIIILIGAWYFGGDLGVLVPATSVSLLIVGGVLRLGLGLLFEFTFLFMPCMVILAIFAGIFFGID